MSKQTWRRTSCHESEGNGERIVRRFASQKAQGEARRYGTIQLLSIRPSAGGFLFSKLLLTLFKIQKLQQVINDESESRMDLARAEKTASDERSKSSYRLKVYILPLLNQITELQIVRSFSMYFALVS